MPAPNRFEIVAPLPSPRRNLHVAIDRGSSPPRAVVLALYPRALSDDPGRLGRLAGEMELAVQLFHPNVLAPEGIEAVGDDLAAVTVWRDAITVREILDAGGALPPEIAARIAADVCAGLSHAHGRPQPVVHGLLRPEAVLLDESGTAVVSGFGMPGGSGIADDILGVGELLHECLAGEPPDDPSVPLTESEAPPSLVAVVNQARAAAPEARHQTADALGAAIALAVPLAARETVAAYVNAVLPAKSGVRAERREKIGAALASTPSVPTEEISDEDIVDGATPPTDEVETPEPDLALAAMALGNDPVAGEPADASPSDASAIGSRVTSTPSSGPPPSPAPSPAPDSIPTATSTAPSTSTAPATSGSIPTSTATATSASPPTAASPATPAPTRTGTVASTASPTSIPAGAPTANAAAPAAPSPGPVHHERSARRGPRVSLATAIAMWLGGVAIGFALAAFTPWHGMAAALLRHAADTLAPTRAPEPVAPEDARAPEPAAPAVSTDVVETPPPAPVRRGSGSAPESKSRARHAAPAATGGSLVTGLLEVTAPEGTEIWLDGRRIGTGNTRREIPVGNHRVEARRGDARIGESFRLAPGETWTYAITPQ